MKYLFLVFLSFAISGTHATTLNLKKTCAYSALEKHDPQYIFLGENHFDYSPAYFFKNVLPKLKQAGFKKVFVEYIESRDQRFLDLFNLDPHKHFQSMVRTFGMNGDWGYDVEKYIALSLTVAKNELQLLGLDRRWDLQGMTNYKKKVAIRDRHMFLVTKDAIDKNPNEKMIFFNGYDHSYAKRGTAGPTFYQYFKKYYSDKRVLNLKFDYRYDLTPQRFQLADENEIINEGCDSDFVLVKDTKSPDFDFYIFKDKEKLFPIDKYEDTIFSLYSD